MVGLRRWARARVRVLTVVLAVLGVQLSWLVAPAYACGCGAMVPQAQRQISVSRETSVLRWDGRQEQIEMRLTVQGDTDRAAWIMPVPHRASVDLGDPALFDQLDAATAPVHRTRHHFWPQAGDWPLDGADDDNAEAPPAAGAAPPRVGVVDRQRLGPFDVARLTATDPGALDNWLRTNGFTFPPRLSDALQPYVDRHWEYVAVRLAPETAGASLSGALDPIHLTFATDEPVYPMRLSRLARTPQSLGLYVLAAHRMEPRSSIGGAPPRVLFAGRLSAPEGPLARLASGTPYLTAVAQEFPQPSLIFADHVLRRTASDTPYQQVIYQDRLLEVAGMPAWLLTIGGSLALVVAVAALIAVRHARRPVVPPPPVHPPAPIG
ncbi:DUF2330 domain-containing protein [Streptomyces sp. HUAS TT20]|uniref:DUF2330 domain-containing protein n=1 Tax=Streptomyces sp. HUAS TT20 TaxID=3447509 RepID=UPI0021DB3EAF|nr:DUF2330 domain-containing protein [Streptomyces sp. HUAS 15-9]UXY27291.1 DUF2330 domain-containing protein [Streptomyces sp. HUAS 15-9]